MKLIVGLGNPGSKYALTRHNVGFMVIDAMAEVFAGERRFKNEFKAETAKIKVGDLPAIICKPQTFMNLSGEAVQPLLQFYNLELSDLLVVHDEIDIPFGEVRFQVKRGHGGHNGIRNIHQMLGSDDYTRLKVGVGRPPMIVDDQGEKRGPMMDVHEWVLHPFSKDEQKLIPEFIDMIIDGVEEWMKHGTSKAASLFNSAKLSERKA